MAKKKKKRAPRGSAAGGIAGLPASDRPRERLLALGPRALSTAELVALVVGSGGAGWSALDLGRALSTAGALRRLREATAAELASRPGLDVARACALVAAVELGRRALREAAEERPVVADTLAAYKVLEPSLAGQRREAFHMLMLDARRRLIGEARIAEGDLTGCPVSPREVVKQALDANAVSVVFAHNHPSGDPRPSEHDLALTERLRAALEATGVEVADHIVIGDGSYYSCAGGQRCLAAG